MRIFIILLLIFMSLPAYPLNVSGEPKYVKSLSIHDITTVKKKKFWKILIYPLIDENINITGFKFVLKINAD